MDLQVFEETDAPEQQRFFFFCKEKFRLLLQMLSVFQKKTREKTYCVLPTNNFRFPWHTKHQHISAQRREPCRLGQF